VPYHGSQLRPKYLLQPHQLRLHCLLLLLRLLYQLAQLLQLVHLMQLMQLHHLV
jgi:hypothetical protein